MSRENIQGVDVTRLGKGVYLVNGYRVEDVKGTTGWRLTATLKSKYDDDVSFTKWFGSLSKARTWIARNRP